MSQTEIYLPDIIGGGYGEFWRFKGRYRVVKGSRRSKKSTTTALWIIFNMMRYPLANTIVVRKVGNTLRDSCFAQLKWAARRLGVYDLWQFNVSPLSATYKPTGQHIYFRGLDDALKLTSIAVDVGTICWVWVEEAYELESEEDFDTATEGIMGDLPDGYFRQVTLTFNPWSSSSWLKARFFDTPNTPDKLAITTTYKFNECLSEEDLRYFEEMREKNPNRYRVAGEGEWGIEGGAFFEEWMDDPQHYADRRFTHVIDPFEVPQDWKIYRGFDFGYAKPFSVGWWACDHDNRLYRILELYGCTEEPNTGVRWPPDQIFREIRNVEEQHRWLKGKRINGIADPSIWDASRGESIYEMACRHGVYFEPGDNARIAGWMQMHYRMAFDANGIPMLYVFRTCKGFIRTIPMLTYDSTKVEDVDTDLEDHIADESRYICMARPYNPPTAAVQQPTPYNPLDTNDQMYDRYDWYRRI
jgi:phage terminase large subunit